MSCYIQPQDLQFGDVVSPTFNPYLQIVFECWHVARLAEALPGEWNADLWSGDYLVWVVCGNRHCPGRPEGEPVQLTIGVGDDVRLHTTGR